MQIERLVQMIFYIAGHGHVTARELSQFFNVSIRTVYRDIDTLTLISTCTNATQATPKW